MDKHIFLETNIINIIIPESTNIIEAIVLEHLPNKNFKCINIIAKKNSCAVIINKLNIKQCNGLLEDYANLTIIKSQENITEKIENQETWNLCNNSSLKFLDLEILNFESQKSYEYFLLGSHSQLNHVTKSLIKNSNRTSLRTNQIHSSQYSKSSVLVKYVILDEAEASYNSLIKIGKNGTETDAIQRQTVLLLSDKAKNIAIPALEVENSAVRCKHGAATGYIDSEHLWYLKSKGFSEKEAYKNILLGFFKEAGENIKCLNSDKIIDNFYSNCILGL